jgi:hypothetical protein
MKIGCYYGEPEIQVQTARALYKGILANGHEAELLPDSKYKTNFDAVAFYGMSVPHIKAWEDYRKAGKPVVICDLGYFGEDRGASGRGHLKVAVNHWHPTEYFQKFKHRNDRFAPFKLPVLPMRKGGSHILLAGIGPKSSVLYGIKHQSWDEAAVAEIRKHTKRQIVYRCKPNHAHTFHKIPGTEWSEPTTPLGKLITDAWAIVTHHSNVGIDGMMKGVPCFANDGVPTAAGLRDLSQIENPRILKPVEQQQFLADLAYTQWTREEIEAGKAWKHLESENLLWKS